MKYKCFNLRDSSHHIIWNDIARVFVDCNQGISQNHSINLWSENDNNNNSNNYNIRNDTDNTMDNRMTINRKQKWEEKQLYGRFKRLINNISHDKTWTGLRKGNFKRETESLLIAAQNNTIRTNYIKARIDKTQKNSKCRLCGNRDETINHIISEWSKLAQKEYKTRHDWVGKVIH